MLKNRTFFFIIIIFIFSFSNCIDTFVYSQTKKEEKQTISPFFGLFYLSSQTASQTSTSSNQKLTFTLPTATGANLFDAAIYNQTGQRIAGISDRLSSSLSYSGIFKVVDSSTGTLSTTDASDTLLGTGNYYYGIYVDSDGDGTINAAGDKVSYGTMSNTVTNTYLVGIHLSDSAFLTPVDVDIQYNVGDITSYNAKNAICYMFVEGVASSISTTSGINNILKTHGVSIAAGVVSAGHFNANIQNFLNSGTIGTSWSTNHYVRYVESNFSGSVFCWVDNIVNGIADVGEPYFRADPVNFGTITVTNMGAFIN